MSDRPFQVYAISDATGGLAFHLAQSACLQFQGIPFKIVKKGKVNTEKKIQEALSEAKEREAIVLFTMVSQDLRRLMLTEAKNQNVVAMDIMGPALDMLSHYFHKLPSSEPGLQYRVTQDYYKRTEAIDFAVRHDDGLSLDTLRQADIVLLGVSRTSKTPLSIFLAYQGHRCANLTVVEGMELPAAVRDVDPKKIVGLIIDPTKLSDIRTSRLKKLGRAQDEDYAQVGTIENELAHAQKVFDTLPGIQIVDVTGKAIEEVASEIIHRLSL